MENKEQIDQKYIDLHNALENEFFDVVKEFKGQVKIGQHHKLKVGKVIGEFNQRHGDIWRNHEAELIAKGFMKAPIPAEPPRDLVAEIDEIKVEQDMIKAKLQEKGIL